MYGALTLEGMCHCAGLSTWVPIAENKPGPESRYWVLHEGEVNDMTCAFDMCLPCNFFYM